MKADVRNRLTRTAFLAALLCPVGAPVLAEVAKTKSASVPQGVAAKADAARVAPAKAPVMFNTPALKQPGGANAAVERVGGRLAEMEQARGLKEVRELSHAAAHLPDRNDSLTDPAGANLGRRDGGRFGSPADLAGQTPDKNAGFQNPMGKYTPDLPSNRDRTRDFGLGPSANPRDWMSGSASSGGKTTERFETGGGNTEVVTTATDANGNVTSRRIDAYGRDGSLINSSTTTYNSDGSSSMRLIYPSGTRVDMRTGESTIFVTEERESFDAQGRSTGSSRGGYILGTGKNDPSPTDPGRRGGIARTIDPNADSGDGSLCRAMPWACRGAPAKSPTQVNPGEEPGGFASAPKIDPGQSIVVNPSTESAVRANQARTVDPAGARRAIESGTKVNPPGPND